MEGDSGLALLLSVFLVLGNALFVAAEYGLVSARRSRIEALARRGNRSAILLMKAFAETSRYVAGIQVAITMFGIGMGSVTEPLVTHWLRERLGTAVPAAAGVALSLLIVTFVFVVIGELVPKYVTMQHAETVALTLIRPLFAFVAISSPLVWLVQRSGGLVLKLFRVKMDQAESPVSREELMLMVQTGGVQGMRDEAFTQVLSRALRFDVLDAKDIMVHRLDVRWIDVDTPSNELLAQVAKCGHSRVPVCRGDLDGMLGLLYLPDLIAALARGSFDLEAILRPVEIVPVNLSLARIVQRMREARTQILVIVDEYGGTAGLLTLEDVVEEVFGEIDDQIESDRPPIERVNAQRLSLRADVRLDEVLEFIGLPVDHDNPASTETLTELIVNQLDRVPRLGDSVETHWGRLRVENMARRRVTRLGLQLSLGGEDRSGNISDSK